MKDLVKYLEIEAQALSGRSRQQFENWIFILRAEFPESFHAIRDTVGSARSDMIVGVSRRNIANANGAYNTYWRAKASSDNGNVLQKSYSVEKYGEINAFKLACILRHEWCGTLMVVDASRLPCLPPVPFESVNEKSKEKKRAHKSKVHIQAELW